MSFTALLFIAALCWLSIGVGVLMHSMSYIRRHALRDDDMLRMWLDDQRRSLLMRLPQLAIVIGWPIAVVFAIVLAIAAQSRASQHSLQ